MNLRTIPITLAMMLALSGCGDLSVSDLASSWLDDINPVSGIKKSRELTRKADKIKKGDKREEVIEVLGKPQKTSSYTRYINKGKLKEVLHYCENGHNYIEVWLRKGEVRAVEFHTQKPKDIDCVADMRDIDWDDAPRDMRYDDNNFRYDDDDFRDY